MLIWIIFAAMTGAAVFVLLWPLGRRDGGAFAEAADARSLYQAQLAEIGRDEARGLMGEAEGEAARAEAGRRFLRGAAQEAEPAGETESSLRRRRAAAAIALSFVPLLTLVIYGGSGSPGQADQPLAARLQADPARQDFDVALARIESHLAANPEDGRGWGVIAPVYLRQGRFDEAARAFSAAIRHDGASAERFTGQGEAQALAAGGVVTSEARRSFAEAVALEPANPRARFFLAIAKEQDGDIDGAAAALRQLLASAPAGAGWSEAVRRRLDSLQGGGAGEAVAALAPADREAAIRGMVEGLSERLRHGGGTASEWARLIRSQLVLGDRPAALAAAATARERLASDQAALAQIDALAGELGLREATP